MNASHEITTLVAAISWLVTGFIVGCFIGGAAGIAIAAVAYVIGLLG